MGVEGDADIVVAKGDEELAGLNSAGVESGEVGVENSVQREDEPRKRSSSIVRGTVITRRSTIDARTRAWRKTSRTGGEAKRQEGDKEKKNKENDVVETHTQGVGFRV